MGSNCFCFWKYDSHASVEGGQGHEHCVAPETSDARQAFSMTTLGGTSGNDLGGHARVHAVCCCTADSLESSETDCVGGANGRHSRCSDSECATPIQQAACGIDQLPRW